MGAADLLGVSFIVSLVFGGCCSNVFTFERLFQYPAIQDTGSFITFCQFVYISIESVAVPFSHKRVVPLKVYMLSVLMFFLSSLGNNMALNYNISVPLHIVFRSFSPVITMINGSLFLKKKYNSSQILAALILTAGCIITSIYRNKEFTWADLHRLLSTNTSWLPAARKNSTGIVLLFGSSYLMSLLQLYNESTYKKYGKHIWKEMLFYTHFLSIPLFALTSLNSITNNLQLLKNNYLSRHFRPSWDSFPTTLVANLVTQSLCVKGVSRLSSSTNALTVSIVLMLRKMLSLLLSVWIFGNTMTKASVFGTVLTFLGTLLYSIGLFSNKASIKK